MGEAEDSLDTPQLQPQNLGILSWAGELLEDPVSCNVSAASIKQASCGVAEVYVVVHQNDLPGQVHRVVDQKSHSGNCVGALPKYRAFAKLFLS